MASKVLVKLETVPFPQGKKLPSDMVALADRNDGINQTLKHQSINVDRVAQLEQNMKFLQEQHQMTLAALHQEVESLRRQNRDLQFELVFSKTTYAASSPSSPEDNGTGFAKSKGSPVSVNVTPLQVELLEKDLQDTKTSLQEAKAQNQCLSEIIEEQKKKLDLSKEEKPKVSVADVGIQVKPKTDIDLTAALQNSQEMVRQLRERNQVQRIEILKLVAAAENCTVFDAIDRVRYGNRNHDDRGSRQNATQEQPPHKFPPLQSQSYWHRGMSRSDHNADYRRHDRSWHDKQNHHAETVGNILPQLRNDTAQSDSGAASQQAHDPGGPNRKLRRPAWRNDTAQTDSGATSQQAVHSGGRNRQLRRTTWRK